jgi:signal transduction histidine kinase
LRCGSRWLAQKWAAHRLVSTGIDRLAGRLAAIFSAPPQSISLDETANAAYQQLHQRAHQSIGSFGHSVEGFDLELRLAAMLREAPAWIDLFAMPKPIDATLIIPSWLNATIARLDAQTPTPMAVETTEPASFVAFMGESLAQLATKINRLKSLEHDFWHALEQEKLSALKEFAYGAGHEINNPLANISARAQTLLKSETDVDRRQKLASINAQAFRAHEMIADLMLFARPPQMTRERIELAPLLAEVAKTSHSQATNQQTQIEINAGEQPLFVYADRASLIVALRALVSNALESLGTGGHVWIAARTIDDVDPAVSLINKVCTNIAIDVRDDGPGISAEARRHIFDPFFSGREAGRGLGFGLTKCWRIVTTQGGQIAVASTPHAGTTFTITLPADCTAQV